MYNNSNSDSSTLSILDDYVLDIDLVIKKLLTGGIIFNIGRFVLSEKETKALAVVAREIFSHEELCLKLQGPIKICGDIHGQYLDLLRLFDLGGQIPQSKYLFLGDYVDRGNKGLECICLLFAYKIKYPKQLFLLRGNHETETITRVYGFRQEVRDKFKSSKMWKLILKTFAQMPFAAVVENSIFCCHGGISPNFMKPDNKYVSDEFKQFVKPIIQVPRQGLLCDLMWADPMDQKNPEEITKGWMLNPRGVSWMFGFDTIDEFLNKYNLDMIIRAHQVVEDGYEFYNGRKLITIFSAPNYMGQFDNSGGIFCLNEDEDSTKDQPLWKATFLILKPNYSQPYQWSKSIDKIPKRKLTSRFVKQ